MSYDIRLVDPVTKEPLHTKVNHDMRGGMYALGGTTELWLNITWNYAHYYYESTDGDKRFAHEEVTGYTNGKPDGMKTEYGIRGIYGKTGAESIPMLEDMINKIVSTYKDESGEWKTARRKRRVVFAENRNQARYIALSTETCEDAAYADIVATRLPVADSQYNGRKEMDWCDPNDRLFLVKNCDVSCVDPEFDECLKCSAKDYCETYDDFLEEYDLCEMEETE